MTSSRCGHPLSGGKAPDVWELRYLPPSKCQLLPELGPHLLRRVWAQRLFLPVPLPSQ